MIVSIGLGRVTQNGPMDNSGLDVKCHARSSGVCHWRFAIRPDSLTDKFIVTLLLESEDGAL